MKPQRPKRHRLLLAASLAAVGVIVIVAFTQVTRPIRYVPIDELLRDKARYAGETIRVRGLLVAGTLTRREEPCETRLSLRDGGFTLPVQYTECVVPDTLRDVPGFAPEITAEGRIQPDGPFRAQLLMAKVSNPYIMKKPNVGGAAWRDLDP